MAGKKISDLNAPIGQINPTTSLLEVSITDVSSPTGYSSVKSSPNDLGISYLVGELFCVVRNTGWTFGIINNASHSPSSNITGISNGTGPNFTITYPSFSKVGSIVANVDETYSKYGLFVGTSVGLSSADFFVYQRGISGYVSYNGSSWSVILNNSLLSGSDFSFAFDAATGKLTVTHTNAAIQNEAFATALTPRLGTTAYNMFLGSVGSTNFEVYFKDYTGSTVLSPNNQMKFYFTRSGMWQVPNSLLAVSGSNIWIYGKMN